MDKEKPRLARLTAILTQLQSKRIVTAREIAEKHKVSIRTVYRDIRTLEKSGIPVYTEEGKGYSLVEGYKLPPVMFTEEEANALITAEQIISRNKDKSLSSYYQSAVEKIKSVLDYTQKDKSQLLSERLQIRINKENEQSSDYLIPVQTAITNFQLLHISYLSAEAKESRRDIEPFALIQTQDRSDWLLIAHCRLRKDFRAFRLDRIQNLHVSSATFEPHTLTLQEYFIEAQKKWESTPDTPLT